MLRRSLLTVLFSLAVSAPALAGDYALSKPHTQALFTVTHLVLTKVHGQIPLVSGEMDIGPNDLPMNVTATFDASAEDTHDSNRDATLRKDYLETAKYPTITFVERKVVGTPSAFTMTGDLTIHGVTKSVDLKGQYLGTMENKGKRLVAYTASTQIDRRDFGMTFGPLLNGALIVDNTVLIEIETEADQK